MLSVQQPNAGNLSDLFGTSSIPAEVAIQQHNVAAQNNAFNMQEAQRQAQEASDLAPYKLEYEKQRARQQGLEADLYEKKQPLELSKLNLAKDKQSAEELVNLGTAFQQAAAIHKTYGGIPPYFQSKFPSEVMAAINEPGGADKLEKMGKALYEHGAGFLKQDQIGDQRQTVAEIQAAERRRATEAANLRAEAANALKARLAAEHNKIMQNKGAAQDPKTWQALATKYTAAANNPNASDEERKMYAEQADRAFQMQTYIASVGAYAKQEGTVDMSKLGNIPTVAPKPAPKPSGNSGYKKDDKGRIVLD